jgi:hypothetical protein
MGQNLSTHPYLHCVVPGGGINFKGQWKQVKTSENGKVFLFRVENLSKVFRAKFISGLEKKLLHDKCFIRDLQQAFGLKVPGNKEKKNWKNICREHLNYDPDICPQCGKGHMSTVEKFFGSRPPPLLLITLNKSF